jgi:hypothetical protein
LAFVGISTELGKEAFEEAVRMIAMVSIITTKAIYYTEEGTTKLCGIVYYETSKAARKAYKYFTRVEHSLWKFVRWYQNEAFNWRVQWVAVILRNLGSKLSQQ